MLVGIELELDFKIECPILLLQRSGQAPPQIVGIVLIGRAQRFAPGDAIFYGSFSETIGHGAKPINFERIAKDPAAKKNVMSLPPARQDIEQRPQRFLVAKEKAEKGQKITRMLGKESVITQQDEIEGAGFIRLKLLAFDLKELERNTAEVFRLIVRNERIRVGKADPAVIGPGFAK